MVEEDTIPPVIENCPSDATYTVPLGTDNRAATWTEPTATDNTGVAPTIVRNIAPGSIFRVGSTQVEYIAYDQAGNEASCSFTITGKFMLPYSACLRLCAIPKYLHLKSYALITATFSSA